MFLFYQVNLFFFASGGPLTESRLLRPAVWGLNRAKRTSSFSQVFDFFVLVFVVAVLLLFCCCFVLFCFVLFCFVLFCFVLFFVLIAFVFLLYFCFY